MASEAEDTPFERYLVSTTDSAFPPSYATGHWTVNDQPPASRTRAVQFQMPQFMQSGPPLLAQGGGVEVLPAAMFVKNNPNADWQPVINNILKPKSSSMNRFISEGITDPQFLQQTYFLAVPGAPLNLPLYSASGFDVLSVLSRVVSRANPQINLGPVDLTTSFCVSDPRRYDHPVIYCSPSFCTLTGYTEGEILGRNCRFLQQPPSLFELTKGARREFTNEAEVATLAKAISTGKECQVSLMNYRKNGNAFLNLVTVIPIWADDDPDEVVYHMGFQIDLSEQPNAILNRLVDGRYLVDSTFRNTGSGNRTGLKDKRFGPSPIDAMSQELEQLLKDPTFQANMPLDPFSDPSPSSTAECLTHFLLSSSPDFIHVLSLKGSFLYCSPGVKEVLGWEGAELVGKSLSDICHASDLVAVLRELKEGSTLSGSSSSHEDNLTGNKNQPRPICLLFRALRKVSISYGNSHSDGAKSKYVWLECRGRLYSEPGKGRKAIILSGRAREMWAVDWNEERTVGPLSYTYSTFSTRKRIREGKSESTHRRELWGLISLHGTILDIGDAVQIVAGWNRMEVLGSSLFALLEARDELQTKLERLSSMGTVSEYLLCSMLRKDGTSVDVEVFLYRARRTCSIEDTNGVCPAPMVFQIQPTLTCTSGSTISTGPLSVPFFPSLDSDESVNWSWQYEIQQVRFENVRLAEEVSKLEDMIGIDDNGDMRESKKLKIGLGKESSESAKHSDRLYSSRALVSETWPSQYNVPISFTSTLSSLRYSGNGATSNDRGDVPITDQELTGLSDAYSVNWTVRRQ